MIRLVACFLLLVITSTGCARLNRNPDILLLDPYLKVKYVAEPGASYKAVEVIQVETSGTQANILNTLPLLYKKALEYSKNSRVEIGNLGVSSYTKLEDVQIPYQKCQSVPEMVSVPQTSCFNGICQTTISNEMRYVQRCTTRYRTEARNVLYQTAIADILISTED